MVKTLLKHALILFLCLLLQSCQKTAAPPEPESLKAYAAIGELKMYYEIHGAGAPLVMVHGALCTIDGCFGKLIPLLSKTRKVIAVELQAHGHTADVDRLLTYPQMASDVATLLRQLSIDQADFFGYSMGCGVVMELALRHPQVARRLIFAAGSYDPTGEYPEVVSNIGKLKPEDFSGSPWLAAYNMVAPKPEDWPVLLEKVQKISADFKGWSSDEVRSIRSPVMLIVGDSDVVRPEHAVEFFRLVGGGVPGDLFGLPRSQLAILPGTTHVTIMDKPEWVSSMVEAFLSAPAPEVK